MSHPMFARRHYVTLAGLIAGGMSELDESGREYVADRLVDLFQSDNYRFRPSRFYAAAGVIAPWDRVQEPQSLTVVS